MNGDLSTPLPSPQPLSRRERGVRKSFSLREKGRDEGSAASGFPFIARLAPLLAAVLLTGCISLSKYERPSQDLPAQWPTADAATAPTSITERWWTLFNDATLDQLIDEAFAHNADFAIAIARVAEARGLANISQANLYPAIDATLARERTRLSEVGGTPLPPDTPLITKNHRATLDVSYELDLFGRLRGAHAAARAQVLATQAAKETVRIGLAAQVAQAYFTLIALDSQVEAARQSAALRERDLELQRVRHRAGLLGDYQLRQQEAEVAAARAQVPALERDRSAQELALAVLLGRSPRAILTEAVARHADTGALPPPVVPEGLPSDLLLRRPDLYEAEQRLIAANAEIGAARAAYFPRIALTGFVGSESASLTNLFTGPARIWQFTAALTQPLFQHGRLRGEVEARRAREQQVLAQYQKAIQNAFREVRQALIAQDRAREIYDAEGQRIAALEDGLRLARIRYDNGLASQLEVLDAERNLLQARLNQIAARRDQRIAVTDVIRALGGGWSGPVGAVN